MREINYQLTFLGVLLLSVSCSTKTTPKEIPLDAISKTSKHTPQDDTLSSNGEKSIEETALYYMASSRAVTVRLEPSAKGTFLGRTLAKVRFPVYEEKLIEDSGCKQPWIRVQYGGWACSDFMEKTQAGEEVEDHFENRFPVQRAFIAKDTDTYDLPGGKVIGSKREGTGVRVYRITRFEGKHYAHIEGNVFVSADDLERFQGRGHHKPPMKGALFDENTRFPVAFFTKEKEGTLLFDAPGISDPEKAIGHKIRYSRNEVLAKVEIEDKTFLRIEGGWVDAEGVVLVSPEARPEGIPEDAHWTLVDLGNQTVNAYKGDQLVFSTLTASGKKSHRGYFWTVTGSYRIEKKYRYKNMEGEPFGEYYLVTDVPWPQYFHRGFAFHGAYWHNKFGRVTSHGCLNLTASDARWMSDFLKPTLPPGWQILFPSLDMETSIIVVKN